MSVSVKKGINDLLVIISFKKYIILYVKFTLVRQLTICHGYSALLGEED